MAAPSVTYTFVNSTTADAAQVNQNFTDVINGLTDGTKDLTINALTLNGAFSLAGALTVGGSTTLGDSAADDLTISALLASTIGIKTTYSYDVGSSTKGLRAIYLGADDSSAHTVKVKAGAVGTSYTLVVPTSGGTTGMFPVTDGTGVLSFRYPDKVLASQTGTYTGTGDEVVIPCNATGGGFTVNLPAAASFTNKKFIIIKTDSSTNAVTVDGNASETINGATTTTLNTQYECLTIVCDGSNWHIVERRIPGTATSFTPTGLWTTAVTYAGFWQRVGDSVQLQITASFSGATDAGSGYIDLPFAIDTAKVASGTSTTNLVLGWGNLYDSSANDSYSIACRYNTTTKLDLYVSVANATYTLQNGAGLTLNSTSPITAASGDKLNLTIRYPVSGWNG